MDDKEKDPIEGLGWKAKNEQLANLHISFNLSSKHGMSGAKQY